MATNLTSAQLAEMQRLLGSGAEAYIPSEQRSYVPIYKGSGQAGDASDYSYTVDGWYGYDWHPGMVKDNAELNGTPFDRYDAQGNYLGSNAWSGLHQNSLMDDLLPLGMVAAPFALTAMGVAGAGAGAAGSAGAAGPGMAGWGADLGMEGLAGATSSGGMGTTLTGTAGGALSAGGAVAGPGMAGWGMDLGMEGLAGATPTSGMGATLTGTAGGALSAGDGGGGGWFSSLKNALPSGASSLLGPVATLAGAAAGGQGQDASASTTRELPEYLRGPVANDLIPRTQGVLNSQLPQAQTAGNQMLSVGSGLLGQTAPTTATNPYATGILDDMQRRYGELIDARLQGIRGNAMSVGGLGGSRQAIAEANAISQGADDFAGQGFNFMGGLYNGDQNRLLQQQTLGAGLMGQGLDTQFSPLKNAVSVYSPFAGNGTTTQNAQSGGGWQGALGGALGAAQFSKNMGWWQ